MSLIPSRRVFNDPLDTWDVSPYDWTDPLTVGRRSLYDPYATTALTNRGVYDPALIRSQQTVNTFSPILAADLVESENDFHVQVDLPGVVPEDIQVNIDRGFLELKAERKQVHREDDGFSRRIERSFGRVSRRLALPPQADQNQADCTFKNGVLTVSFKKVEGAGPARRQLLIK